MLGVGVTGGVAAVLVEQPGSVVAHRLQQPVPAAVADGVGFDHRPVDQLHHQIGRFARSNPSTSNTASAARRSNPPENTDNKANPSR